MASIEVISTVRIGQLTGTTGDAWPLLVDPIGSPLLTDTGRWGVIGVDLGANAEHADGRLYVFFGDVATAQPTDWSPLVNPHVPPLNSDLVAWTDEPSIAGHGGHLAMGLQFVLPIAQPGAEGQDQWRFCLKCSALFWNGDAQFKGRCPKGGAHDTFGLGMNFVIPFEPTTIAGQPQWRFCANCAGLFWEGDPAFNGACPAGGEHVAIGNRFVVPVAPQAVNGQPDWRFCGNCHGLFWDGEAPKGLCAGAPGGGFHLHGVLQDGVQAAEFDPLRAQVGMFDPFRAAEPIGYTGSLETPNGAFSFDGTMYVFAGISEVKYSHRRRNGDPTLGQYLFSKSDPSAPGPYQTEFLFSPKLGWCATDRSRASFESHTILGLHFVLPHDLAPSQERQNGWRSCRKCEALFWNGDANFKGVCQRGGPHEPDSEVPDDFSLEHSVPEDAQNQSGWRLCRKCQALFWSADPEDTGLCPATGDHEPTGLMFRIPHISIEEDSHHQANWRFCRKCSALYWNGDGGSKGICPRDHGPHEAAGYNFVLPHDLGEDAGSQTRWRFCVKCFALFFDDDLARGTCPSDGATHQAAGFIFTLPHSTAESLDRQTQWRFCRKCSELFFNGFEDKGFCPRDGQGHEAAGLDFALSHNPGEDANNRGAFRFCIRCHQLVRTDRPVSFPWIAPCVIDNADHGVLESRTGQGVVMIGFDWRAFRLLWMPLTPGVKPSFDTVRYYHAGKRQWSDLVDDAEGYGIFQHPFPNQYTHVSATWLREPKCWVVLFATAWDLTQRFTEPIIARFSPDLINWSDPVPVFDPIREQAYGRYMHEPGHDRIHPDLPPSQPPGQDNKGWAYGAFILDRYTSWDGTSRVLSLYYLLSTGSPYQVHLMHSTLRLPVQL